MDNLQFNSNLLDQYLSILSKLSIEARKYLIQKLEKSIEDKNENQEEDLFGAWKSDEGSDELIQLIESSRIFERQIEGFE